MNTKLLTLLKCIRHARLIALTLALTLMISACDLVEGPKVDPTTFPTAGKKVLIDDFTAQRCGYCPRAHHAANILKESYPNDVVVVAMHASGLAIPQPNLGYPNDFRTTMGTELDAYYKAEQLRGYPVGLVNRRNWGPDALVDYSEWGSRVASIFRRRLR